MSERDLDPRGAPSDGAPAVDSAGVLRPAVAGTSTGASVWLVGGGAVLAGLLVFLWLSNHRPGPPREVTRPPPDAGMAATTAPVVPSEIDAAEEAARAPPPSVIPAGPPAVAVVSPPPLTPAPVVQAPPAQPELNSEAQRRRAPSLVVDFGEAGAPVAAPANGTTPSGKIGGQPVNDPEQFAERLEAAQPERARAVMLRNKSTTIPQGAMIAAVLETALNSDLPGFTRAVVSRDVRSFDGSTVLIPRGSRVIGQYKSGLAQGASRAFVIWTRVLRPDGASIQIGSNGADELGRAGLAGKVDRHFFERFSGSVLLSVITLGQAALTSGNSTQVVIGSSSDAGSIAGAASALAPQQLSPTIKVPQGSPIRIFVARDLDFTSVDGSDQ